jgi:hypothetical protein
VRAGLVVVITALLVAACTPERPFGEVTEVDRQRYETLRADPVFTTLGVAPRGSPGEYRDWLLVRGTVSVELVGLTADAFRARGLAALDDAIGNGWIVYRTECVGGTSSGPPVLWTAWAYKITDGVSYLLKIASATSSSTYPVSGDGAILLDAYVPNSGESTADLIAEHPPAVADPCMRAASPPADTTVQGLDVTFDSGFNRNTGTRAGIR